MRRRLHVLARRSILLLPLVTEEEQDSDANQGNGGNTTDNAADNGSHGGLLIALAATIVVAAAAAAAIATVTGCLGRTAPSLSGIGDPQGRQGGRRHGRGARHQCPGDTLAAGAAGLRVLAPDIVGAGPGIAADAGAGDADTPALLLSRGAPVRGTAATDLAAGAAALRVAVEPDVAVRPSEPVAAGSSPGHTEARPASDLAGEALVVASGESVEAVGQAGAA